MGGALKPLHAIDMAECVLKGSLDRTGVDPKAVDEVIMGQCRQTSDEPNIARVAALRVGIPDECPAYTVMRQCASGMDSRSERRDGDYDGTRRRCVGRRKPRACPTQCSICATPAGASAPAM